MNNNAMSDFRNPALIRKAGLDALKRELGVVGAVYFVRQFFSGGGDYTFERRQLHEGITLDEILADIYKIESNDVNDVSTLTEIQLR